MTQDTSIKTKIVKYKRLVFTVSILLSFIAVYCVIFLTTYRVHQGMRTLVGTGVTVDNTLMYSTGTSKTQSIKNTIFYPLIALYETNGYELVDDSSGLDTQPGPRLLNYHFKIILDKLD